MHAVQRPAAAGFQVDVSSGLLLPARQVPSPNHDERPEGVEPELIVVHGISLPPGEFGGPWIERLFTNELPADGHPYFASIHQQRVSAHVLIARDGLVTQFVPFHLRAWHAGTSCWRGRERCNDFSIGIEVEGDDALPYEPAQYETLAAVATVLIRAYPGIAPHALTGHEHVAPGRKTDPGPAFDWPRLQGLLHTALAARHSGLPS